MYRIKRITNAAKPRAYVTIEELDAQDKPTGRTWTEPFSTEKKDWAELKERFKDRIKESDDETTANINLTTEGNDASLTDMS